MTMNMNMMNPKNHPGDAMTAISTFRKALDFHEGSEKLEGDAARLLALQAIEGYLMAYLRFHDTKNEDLRSMNHDLVRLADMAGACGLILRNRTHVHLSRMTTSREYLTVRYGSSASEEKSQPTALAATLSELMQKVGQVVKKTG